MKSCRNVSFYRFRGREFAGSVTPISRFIQSRGSP